MVIRIFSAAFSIKNLPERMSRFFSSYSDIIKHAKGLFDQNHINNLYVHRLWLNYLSRKLSKGAPKLCHFKQMCFVMLVVCLLLSYELSSFTGILYSVGFEFWQVNVPWYQHISPLPNCFRWEWSSSWYKTWNLQAMQRVRSGQYRVGINLILVTSLRSVVQLIIFEMSRCMYKLEYSEWKVLVLHARELEKLYRYGTNRLLYYAILILFYMI